MTAFPLDKIWLDRTTRQRRDLGDLTDLAASIKTIGLINPLTITKEGELLAGERRYTAIKSLGWSHVPVNFFEDLSPSAKQQLELDENIRRLDLPWQDRVRALAKYHTLCLEESGPEWRQEDTADKIGLSRSNVSYTLQVADWMDDERVANAETFSKARGIVERVSARRRDTEAEQIERLISGNDKPNPEVSETIHEDEQEAASDIPILRTDFIEWTKTYTGPKFNLIHCDFPYGIDADKHNQGAADTQGGYEDSTDVYWELIEQLNLFGQKHIAESAHMIFWFSMRYYYNTLDIFQSSGWTVNPTPLIWHKTDNTGIIPDPRRMPRQIYETAFLCSRGDRFLVQPRANCFGAPTTKQYHMSEKSLPMLQHFLSMVCDETTTFLDPTCGSANSLIAAQRLGAQTILGLERDPEFHERACENWRANTDG